MRPAGSHLRSHTFKCRTDQEANQLAFAAARTMTLNAKRRKPEGGIAAASHDELETVVKWWNASNPPIHHYRIGKDDTISGNLRVQCQVDKSLKVSLRSSCSCKL